MKDWRKNRPLLVLDAFSGLGGMADERGGWSGAFRERGHRVVTLDLESRFAPTIVADVLELKPEALAVFGRFDAILASPPCEAFSVASIGTHWGGGWRVYEPKSEKARTSLTLVERTLALIEALEPRFWILENPT